MAGTHYGSAQPTEKQLKLSLKNTKYLHPGPAAKQIVVGLDEFADLKPSVKEYTMDDGKRVDLMQLSGIIPIKILEKQHNVPVRVWFPRAFPREKPIIFINAGQDLALATLDYVDSQGRVNLPYLRDWKESRSDISTLLKMLKFKFGQHCPVQVRGKRFSLDVPHATNSNNPSPVAPRKFESSPQPLPPRRSSVQEQQVTELKKEIESKDYELASYKKTITTLSTETDQLRTRVRDLEQEKHESQIFCAAQEREERAVSGAYEEVMVELERSKVEGEKLRQQLQEESEKLTKEMKEKEKLRSRLDAKVSDLTQTREKIAILEVEKEDYQLRLQKALRDLKYYKAEIRELMHVKRALNAKVTTLEDLIRSLQVGSESSESEAETSEGEVTDASVESEMLLHVEREKLEPAELAGGQAKMASEQRATEELKQSTELISESEALTGQAKSSSEETSKDNLNRSSLAELADGQTQTDSLIPDDSVRAEHAEKEVQVCFLSSHEEKAVQAHDPVEFAETKVQVGLVAGFKDAEVQVDTLLVKYTRYKQFAEDKSMEVKRLKEELAGIRGTHQSALKESEGKVHQLLSIKARLTAKNAELSQKVEELSSTDIQSSLSSALQTISDLQKDLVGDGQEESGRLEKTLTEMEEMKKAHKMEIQAIIQKVAKANLKVKEEEVKLNGEIKDLKAKLESTQQQLKAASNASALQQGHMEGGRDRMPENCLVSFMEVESDALCTLDGGTWGDLSSEVTFRGKRVSAFCVPKESLAQFPIHVIHKQVSTMSQLRHPNLVLFIAIAMDAPAGLMILTELTTCSLRQAYQSQLLGKSKLSVLLDVAYALNFLHLQKRPVVHNNLSSLSVVVEEGGGGGEGEWRAKLSDLGSTTSLMTLSENKERERVYFAPEIAGGGVAKLGAGTPVDLYSYGILMCELSASFLPRSSAAISESVGNLKPSLPQISCLIQCCLTANPDQRPLMGSMLRKVKHLVVNKIHVP